LKTVVEMFHYVEFVKNLDIQHFDIFGTLIFFSSLREICVFFPNRNISFVRRSNTK
jgi:hypothetical protein